MRFGSTASIQDNGVEYEVFVGRATPFRTTQHEDSDFEQSKLVKSFTQQFEINLQIVNDRKVFITKEGYYGLGSSKIQVGDEIVVVPGLDMPIVFREQPERGTHVLLGAAYVHGIMHGEFLDGLRSLETVFQQEVFQVE